MHIINGRLGLSGKLSLGLVRRSGRCKFIRWGFDGKGDERHAWIESERHDQSGQTLRTQFSVKQAMRAGLWGKKGPWETYPDRMMFWRAAGFHLADHYSDVTLGLPIAEELRDRPARGDRTLPQPRQAPVYDPLLGDEPAAVEVFDVTDASEIEDVETEKEGD
jgi:hypothetical protein